jgi:hypothetical protein
MVMQVYFQIAYHGTKQGLQVPVSQYFSNQQAKLSHFVIFTQKTTATMA